MTVVDPLAALQTVFQNYVSYQSDDASPVNETYSNNGLVIEIYPQGKNKHKIAPMIEIGPIAHTQVRPQNIGDSPNSRWLYKHYITCRLETQTYQSPNISGYNARAKIWESIRSTLVKYQSNVDGSGNWMLMKLSAGPYDGSDTSLTPDRYEFVFVVELLRSAVD